MKSRYRTWLAVPPEETEAVKNAVPPLNGRKAVAWDPEKKLWYARAGTELSLLERWLPRPQELSMDAGDPVTEFAQVLENAGLVIQGLPQMDGAIHRVATRDDKKGAKSGAYRAYLDGRPAGWYRDYRSADDSPTNWVFSGGEQHDPLARLHLRAFAQQQRDDNARKLQQQYNKQAGYARSYINRLPQATAHEYLTRKGIRAAPGVRLNNKNELVIPFSNGRGEIRSYQRIPVTGGKDARILKDSEKTGNWFTFGTPENGRPLLFAEGYATAASLHEATGLPVLMTVDASNMIAVAENARQIWTDSPFVFCADNDHQREINKGVFSATKAAEVTNGEVIIPAFTEAEKAQGLTDFNDLDASRGRDNFQNAMNAQLKHIGILTLTMLKDSITTLSNAIQKDEAWAQETRQLLEETRKQVHTLQMQGALPAPTGNNRQPAKTLPSPLQGMKIMSVEKGMAWIRWQGSAWAVREGDSLGNITITRIDPSSRAVITSAGTLR